MNENNNVYYDLDNDGRNDDFLNQERQNEQNERGNSGEIVIPHYEAPQEQAKSENSGYAIASLICGIIGLLCCTFIPAVLAIVFYFIDKNNTGKPNQLAKTGMILGIISIALSVIFLIAYFGIVIFAAIAAGASYWLNWSTSFLGVLLSYVLVFLHIYWMKYVKDGNLYEHLWGYC